MVDLWQIFYHLQKRAPTNNNFSKLSRNTYWIFIEKKRVQFDNKSAHWEKDQRTLAASLSNFREKQTTAEVNRMFSQEGEVLQLLRRLKNCVFRDQRTIM